MNQFVQAMALINDMCRKADAEDEPTITIEFSSIRDKALFEEELKRGMGNHVHMMPQPSYLSVGKMQVCGIPIEIKGPTTKLWGSL
jgi:hypothetical protein